MNHAVEWNWWVGFGLLLMTKATLLLGFAWTAAWALRHRSAADRHLVWILACVGLLLLPLTSLLPTDSRIRVPLPSWATVSPPDFDRLPVADVPETSGRLASTATAGGQLREGASPFIGARQETKSRATRSPGVLGAVPLVWLVGSILLSCRSLLGFLYASSLPGRLSDVRDPEVIERLRRLSRELGITRSIRLLRGGGDSMPSAAGVLEPWVLLPDEGVRWTARRQESVLRHELAHVRRHDPLAELIVQATCALYWIHPLVWIAATRLRTEREHACDDLVLLSGTKATEYAADLLAIATMLTDRTLGTRATIAMAHPSRLRTRLTAVLEDRPRASGVPASRAAAGLLGAIGLIVVLGAFGPVSRHQSQGDLSRTYLPDAESPARPDASGRLQVIERTAQRPHDGGHLVSLADIEGSDPSGSAGLPQGPVGEWQNHLSEAAPLGSEPVLPPDVSSSASTNGTPAVAPRAAGGGIRGMAARAEDDSVGLRVGLARRTTETLPGPQPGVAGRPPETSSGSQPRLRADAAENATVVRSSTSHMRREGATSAQPALLVRIRGTSATARPGMPAGDARDEP